MTQHIQLPLGRRHIHLKLPQDCEPVIIRKPETPPIRHPDKAVARALDGTPAAPSLHALAKGRHSACIVICDITRPVPNHLFLRPMITRLVNGGIPLKAIKILVATGLHRPNLGDELRTLIQDDWVINHVRIINHNALDDAMHSDLGATATRATPVRINRHFTEADLRIVTGLVEPHFMAGWSGGRKVISPGIAHHTTIRTFHSARFMSDPAVHPCNLQANPLHEEQLEIARTLAPVYAFNTVLDESRRLTYVNFGEAISSHSRAVEAAREQCIVHTSHRFNTVVTSAAGYPLDQNYYQTIKAMVTPLGILKTGGQLLVASDCREGLGSEHFRKTQRRLISQGIRTFDQALHRKVLADIDEWQTQMQLRPMRCGSVGLYSPNLPETDWPDTGVTRITDLTDAVADSIKRSGDKRVAVIPEGPYVIPTTSA